MSRPVFAAFAASCLSTMALAGSAFAATPMDMSPPAPWTTTGATPVVQLDAQKHPAMIGLTIPGALIADLPKKRSEAVFPLTNAGLVQSANLQWHPSGHEPEHVYDVPHFDLHFFTISEAVRGSIVPGAKAGKVMPAKKLLIPNSILAPGFVPGMGMHDVSKTQPEFGGGKFTISPIVGYWNGELNFFEVMFTKAWIEQKRDMVAAYPQPGAVTKHGYYPTKYSVKYDKASDSYQIALTGFVKR